MASQKIKNRNQKSKIKKTKNSFFFLLKNEKAEKLRRSFFQGGFLSDFVENGRQNYCRDNLN